MLWKDAWILRPATMTQKQRFSHSVHAPTLTHQPATATAMCWTNVACVVALVPSTIVVATNCLRVIAIATATSWMLWACAVATALQMQTVMACATMWIHAWAPKMLAACATVPAPSTSVVVKTFLREIAIATATSLTPSACVVAPAWLTPTATVFAMMQKSQAVRTVQHATTMPWHRKTMVLAISALVSSQAPNTR